MCIFVTDSIVRYYNEYNRKIGTMSTSSSLVHCNQIGICVFGIDENFFSFYHHNINIALGFLYYVDNINPSSKCTTHILCDEYNKNDIRVIRKL